MTKMNAEKAREIVELHKHLEKAIDDSNLRLPMDQAICSYLEARSYLAALEGPEAREKDARIAKLEEENEALLREVARRS